MGAQWHAPLVGVEEWVENNKCLGTNQRLNTRVKVLLLESGRHTKETSTDDQYSNRVSAISPTSTKMFQCELIFELITKFK